MRGSATFLLQHLLQKQRPQRRQWCCKRTQSEETERRGQAHPAVMTGRKTSAEERISAPETTTEAAAAICGQPENNADLSPDEVKLGVTLHTSGTLEAEGEGEKQDVTQ